MTNEITVEAFDLSMRFPREQTWRSLWKRGEQKLVLDRINLAVSRGEVVGLLGPNGAGKTTFVKCLSTLLIPSAGTARIMGLDVVKDGREVRRRVGVVYGDERSFFWRLSVRENLRFYASLAGLRSRDADPVIDRLLRTVGLEHAADKRMHHFSSGMRQRASIARGLLSDPDVLILDEPTRNLDPIGANELRELVRERVVDGQRTVLLVTNVMAEAEQLCDRIAFLNHGRIQMMGTIDYLRDLLAYEEAHEMVVGGVNGTLQAGVSAIPGVTSLEVFPLSNGTHRLSLNTQKGSPAVPAVIRYVVEEGGSVWSSTPRELTLEEIFAIAVNQANEVRQPVEVGS